MLNISKVTLFLDINQFNWYTGVVWNKSFMTFHIAILHHNKYCFDPIQQILFTHRQTSHTPLISRSKNRWMLFKILPKIIIKQEYGKNVYNPLCLSGIRSCRKPITYPMLFHVFAKFKSRHFMNYVLWHNSIFVMLHGNAW